MTKERGKARVLLIRGRGFLDHHDDGFAGDPEWPRCGRTWAEGERLAFDLRNVIVYWPGEEER